MRRALAFVALASLAACSGGDRPYVPGVDAPAEPTDDAAGWSTDAAEVVDAPSRVDAGIDAPGRVDAGIDAPGPSGLAVRVVGQGLVVSNPAGIRCQPTCMASFPPGVAVTLTAIPAAGWSFVGWSGSCSGGGPCSVPGVGAVTATFQQNMTPGCVLGVERQGPGQGTVVSAPAGINCGPDCREPYPCGSLVTLTAVPAAGSVFSGWSGACTGLGTCTVAVSQPFQAAIATFR